MSRECFFLHHPGARLSLPVDTPPDPLGSSLCVVLLVLYRWRLLRGLQACCVGVTSVLLPRGVAGDVRGLAALLFSFRSRASLHARFLRALGISFVFFRVLPANTTGQVDDLVRSHRSDPGDCSVHLMTLGGPGQNQGY